MLIPSRALLKSIAILLLLLIFAASGQMNKVHAQVSPFGQGGNWTLYFDDEFNGTNLDTNKWHPNWFGGTDSSVTPPVNSEETTCYDPSNILISNGYLTINTKANNNSNCKDRSGNVAKYSSGIIQSHGKFDFSYGYMEASIQMPAGSGVWPAFWADGSPLNWPASGEIDIEECYGTDASCSYHYHYSGGGPGGNYTVAGSTTGFHTYAADWEPGSITWYYDGVKVWQYTTGIVSNNMFLIANLGLKNTSASVPSQMKIDYIRVWKKNSASFTTKPSSVPTQNAKQGDINGDGKVDIIDIGIIIDNYAKKPVPNLKADLNHDGVVDIVDIGIAIDNYGK